MRPKRNRTVRYPGNPVAAWCDANGGVPAKRVLAGPEESLTSVQWQTVHELVEGLTSPTATTAAKLEANSGGSLDALAVLAWYARAQVAA